MQQISSLSNNTLLVTSRSLKSLPVVFRDCRPQSKAKTSAGFTLLEIIIVITIIAAISGMAVLSMNFFSPSRLLNQTSDRMNAVVRMLYDESILAGREYGLMLYRDGYRVLEWYEPPLPKSITPDDNDSKTQSDSAGTLKNNQQTPQSYWRPITGTRFKSAHEFPESIEMTADVEGADLTLPELSEHDALIEQIIAAETEENSADQDQTSKTKQIHKEAAALNPPLLFLSSGEATEFILRLSLSSDPTKAYVLQGDIAGNISFIRPGQEAL